MDDLRPMYPSMTQGLDQLLATTDDVQEIYDRTFEVPSLASHHISPRDSPSLHQIAEDGGRGVVHYELKPAGASIPLTNTNRSVRHVL